MTFLNYYVEEVIVQLKYLTQIDSFIYETVRSSKNKILNRYRCVDCQTPISSMRDAIDHVEDSVKPTESDIMGNFDDVIKTFNDHPDL